MADTTSLLASIATQGASYAASKDNETRKALISSLTQLAVSLETPMETTLRWNWGIPACAFAINVGTKMRLFDHLSLTEAKSSNDLAKVTNSDPVFLARLLKHMAASHVLIEKDHDMYLATPFAAKLTDPMYYDWFRLFNDTIEPSYRAGPEYYASTGFKNPTDVTNCAFQKGLNTDLPFFAWLQEDPARGQTMNNAMTGYQQDRKMWCEEGCYPVTERLVSGADEAGVLLVDVGGGVGRDVNAFARQYGGKCVLAELPEVVQAAKVVEGVQAVEYNFLEGPPVAGKSIDVYTI